MMFSTFVITILGTLITEKIVEPRLGEYKGSHDVDKITDLTDLEKKGLRYSGIALLIFVALMAYLTVPADAVFRVDGTLNKFMSNGLLVAIMFFFMIPGVVYGVVTKQLKMIKMLLLLWVKL